MNDFELRSLYDQVQAMEVKIKALEVLIGAKMSDDELVAEEELVEEEEAEEEAVEEEAVEEEALEEEADDAAEEE